MFADPSRNRAGLNFSLFGIPVLILPEFLILPVVMGMPFTRLPDLNAGVVILLFVLIFFVSILVHELGHVLAFRYFGLASRIVLHAMGGLAIPDAQVWFAGRHRSLTPPQQIIVSVAGPLAGFLLAAVLAGLVLALGGTLNAMFDGLLPALVPDWDGTPFVDNLPVRLVFLVALWANIAWGILNLVPVLPLDGGQVARQICLMVDPRNGEARALWLSVFAGATMAVVGMMTHNTFLAIFFGYLALTAYMSTRMTGGFGGGPW